MKIHFVCTGNTYRSRMAEAYLRSKKIDSLEVSSSGTHAHTNENGPISWLSAWVLKRESLIEHVAPSWIQTTKELLDASDQIIFMEDSHRLYCVRELDFQRTNFQVWNIKDVGANLSDIEKMEVAAETFSQIQKKTNELLSQIS